MKNIYQCKVFGPFGDFTSNIKKDRYQAKPGFAEQLVNIWSGKRSFAMRITTDIPNFCYIEGRKCRVYYQGMTKLCLNCGESEVTCPGFANAGACKETRQRKRVDLEQVFNNIRRDAIREKEARENSYIEAANRRRAELGEELETVCFHLPLGVPLLRLPPSGVAPPRRAGR